jgi:MYXO-CTERM domain-containing protein
MPGSSGATSTAGNGGIIVTNMGGAPSVGGGTGSGNNTGSGADSGVTGRRAADAAGCGCRLDGERRTHVASLFALGFVLLLLGGRRRRRPLA